MTALAILALLAGLSVGAAAAGHAHAMRDRARAELAGLTQVVARYRYANGDLPPESLSAASLHELLDPARGSAHPPVNWVDPWGANYEYVGFTRQAVNSEANARGYLLYSTGPRAAGAPLPTRAEVVPETSGPRGGEVDVLNPLNAANIYAQPL